MEKELESNKEIEKTEEISDKEFLTEIVNTLSGIAEKELESNGRSMYFMRILQTKRFAEEAVKLLN